jgi:hypothetical protein
MMRLEALDERDGIVTPEKWVSPSLGSPRARQRRRHHAKSSALLVRQNSSPSVFWFQVSAFRFLNGGNPLVPHWNIHRLHEVTNTGDMREIPPVIVYGRWA